MDRPIVSDVSERLINQATINLPHALILSGRHGVGVGQIAEYIARTNGTLLETIRPKKRQPSGGYAVDTENGTIIIEDIRDLYTRTRSKFKSRQIVVIDFANRTMSPQAQNAFLKLLEEPGENVHFILATQQIGQLLPTVLSRCQRIDVQPLSSKQTVDLLDGLSITDPTRRSRIQFIANGLAVEMTRLATDDAYYEERIKTVQDARTLLGGDSYVRLVIIHKYKDKRPAALLLIDDMIQQLRMSVTKSPTAMLTTQLDTLVTAYDHIQANGNIQLNLAKVLL